MPKSSLSIGVVVLAAAAVVLPGQAQAEHENRYFGFGYYPYGYTPPPVVYPPPPRMRQSAPGVYEYEVSPGRWVRVRPGYVYPPRQERQRRVRTPQQQPQEVRRSPAPPPVPERKPDATDEPEVVVRSAPESTLPAQSPEQSEALQASTSTSGGGISCEAAADIVKSFGFSDVQSTGCSGDTYGFDASRDGKAYSIKLSAADGELTEVRKR